MGNNIKEKLIKGTLWNTIEKVAIKSASFVIGIILARLLSPEDYGLIGMLMIFISLSSIFIESGFAKALIQKQDRTDIDFSTTFYFNLGVSLLLYLALYITAPYIASFYNFPILSPLLRVLSINIIIASINIVQRAKLMIEMDFKSLAKINFLGTLVGGIGGILLAYKDFGVWALAGQYLISTLTMTILFFKYSHWTPTLHFSFISFKKLFRFGFNLLIAGSITTIFNNIATIAIGKLYKSSQLGYYTRANQFTDMIAWTINDVLGNVTFPILSELQNDRERLISIYKKSLFYTSLITFPIMTLLAILAKPIILLLLTEKWLPCVALLQILCFARMLTPLSAINMNALNAIGRSDLFLKIDLSKLPIDIFFLIVTIPLGIKAIVIGNLISTVICFFINAYYPGKILNYGPIKQLKDFIRVFISIGVMSIFVILIRTHIDNVSLQLLLGSILGITIYIICCKIFNIISFSHFNIFSQYIHKNNRNEI